APSPYSFSTAQLPGAPARLWTPGGGASPFQAAGWMFRGHLRVVSPEQTNPSEGHYMPKDHDNKGSMTVAEAGRKGGVTVRNERGREFYETIGRKGGATVKASRGRAFYEEIGRKGGETVKAERGPKFYEEIGKKGGDRVKATRGPTFYEEIGRKGGQKVKRLIEEG